MNKVRITTKADQCLEVEQVGWTLKQIDTLTSLDIRKMTTLSSLGQLKFEHFGIFRHLWHIENWKWHFWHLVDAFFWCIFSSTSYLRLLRGMTIGFWSRQGQNLLRKKRRRKRYFQSFALWWNCINCLCNLDPYNINARVHTKWHNIHDSLILWNC